jgi:hypothetical protein
MPTIVGSRTKVTIAVSFFFDHLPSPNLAKRQSVPTAPSRSSMEQRSVHSYTPPPCNHQPRRRYNISVKIKRSVYMVQNTRHFTNHGIARKCTTISGVCTRDPQRVPYTTPAAYPWAGTLSASINERLDSTKYSRYFRPSGFTRYGETITVGNIFGNEGQAYADLEKPFPSAIANPFRCPNHRNDLQQQARSESDGMEIRPLPSKLALRLNGNDLLIKRRYRLGGGGKGRIKERAKTKREGHPR